MPDNKFSGSVDPDIADLFGIQEKKTEIVAAPEPVQELEPGPEFGSLFEADSDGAAPGEMDTSVRSFDRPKILEEAAKPFFTDKDYYKKVLGGEGDQSKKLHDTLTSFLQTQDQTERSNLRNRIIPIFWDLMGQMAPKIAQDLSQSKRVFMRYGVLLPSLLSDEQRALFSKIIWENKTNEPLFYQDEWLKAVARGQVSASATDETKPKVKGDEKQRIGALLDRTKGKYDGQISFVRGKIGEMDALESDLIQKVNLVREHSTMTDFGNMKAPYSESQRSTMNAIVDVLRRLGNANRELSTAYQELAVLKDQLGKLKSKDAELGDSSVDNKVIVDEMNTLRQMAKMCVGRQGNHFPIAMKQFLRSNPLDYATRENVINILADVEHIDPGIFLRTFKQQTNRIVPNIIILPCYGDLGICWEPFEKFNRATGRGRVAIPLFPKDLRLAVITACADLRWQVAKEKAQHYWMEEGLTGWYYQLFSDRKLKGDVREAFIADYILWLMKESEGMQKMDKESRAIFWRYIPFPQDIKDKLKTRGFAYAELAKKDQNRAMSDGY